jgi:predicted phosphoribosyltransferase
MSALFLNRRDAGRKLAAKLKAYAGRGDVIVLGLPRGGVPVAFEVAKALGAPLDVFLVRKLGTPGQEELAMGAIASGGTRVMNEDLVARLGISEKEIAGIEASERTELERRERTYRGGRPPLDVKGCTAILVDDGLATGASMRAAVQALKKLGPARIVVAVPTAPPDTCLEFRGEVDEIVCAETPEPYWSVGSWYEDFRQTTDEEVSQFLEEAPAAPARPAEAPKKKKAGPP